MVVTTYSSPHIPIDWSYNYFKQKIKVSNQEKISQLMIEGDLVCLNRLGHTGIGSEAPI